MIVPKRSLVVISRADTVLTDTSFKLRRMASWPFKLSQIPTPPTPSLENFTKADYRLEEEMVRSYFRLQNNTILLKHYEKFME